MELIQLLNTGTPRCVVVELLNTGTPRCVVVRLLNTGTPRCLCVDVLGCLRCLDVKSISVTVKETLKGTQKRNAFT